MFVPDSLEFGFWVISDDGLYLRGLSKKYLQISGSILANDLLSAVTQIKLATIQLLLANYNTRGGL